MNILEIPVYSRKVLAKIKAKFEQEILGSNSSLWKASGSVLRRFVIPSSLSGQLLALEKQPVLGPSSCSNKVPQTGGLINRNLLLPVLEAEIQGQGQLSCIVVRALSVPSWPRPTVSSHGGLYVLLLPGTRGEPHTYGLLIISGFYFNIES